MVLAAAGMGPVAGHTEDSLMKTSTCSFALLFALAGAVHAADPATQPAGGAPAAGGGASAAGGGGGGAAPYKVVDGYKVDPATMEGFRTWRAAACDRCHGANQEGMVGPSLIGSLQKLSKEQFVDIVANGRNTRGVMPAFKSNKTVMENMDGLYAYLKGRSDGAITQAKVEPMTK